MISSKHVEQLLRGQSTTARKLYDCLTDEPLLVKDIMTTFKRHNGGNTPDRKVISGCLNDMTDTGLLKRTGRDYYSRAPVRKLQPSLEEKQPQPILSSSVTETVIMASKPKPPVTAVTKEPGNETFVALRLHAASLSTLGETITQMAKDLDKLAVQLQEEREAGKKKADQIDQLTALLKTFQN